MHFAPTHCRCWTADWDFRTCKPVMTIQECRLASLSSAIFHSPDHCCSSMQAGGVWRNETTAQGICALPKNQATCYIPSRTLRTCEKQTVGWVDGKWRGCAGTGLDIFPDPNTCCKYLVKVEAIQYPEKPASGICANPNPTCYVPDYM